MRLLPLLGLALASAVPSPAPAADKVRKPVPAHVGPPPKGAWFVDDEDVFANLMDRLAVMAKAGKLMPHDILKARIKEGGARVSPVKPGDRPLSPEEVYKAAVPGVFVVGSVVKDGEGGWTDGRYATAWALTADGVLVTNWHVFTDTEKEEAFGVADHKGNVYAVTGFLGGDKTADVALFKIAAANLAPLPVATTSADIGSWVGVLSHPGDQFYMFTQGTVSRYNRSRTEDGRTEKWLNITADYATGSSGGPVLNRYGSVVGMAAMTIAIDYPEDKPPESAEKPEPKDRMGDPARTKEPPVAKGSDKPKPKAGEPGKDPEPPEVKPSTLQMVVKLAVPSSLILRRGRRTAAGERGAHAPPASYRKGIGPTRDRPATIMCNPLSSESDK